MHKRNLRRAVKNVSASKPGVFSLLLHILKGSFTSGMLLTALLCIGLIAILYQGAYPYHEAISGLLVTGLAFIGLFRGGASCQQEVIEYRQKLISLHHQQQVGEANRQRAIPRFLPYTHSRR